jgi:hypothetical protein
MSSLTLDLWRIDLKTHKGYQFFKMTYSVQSLMSVKDIEWSVYSNVQFDLKIDSGHLLFKMY